MTPAALAHHLRITERTVNNWLSTGQVPQRKVAADAAHFLGVPVSELWPRRVPVSRRLSLSEEIDQEWVLAYTERSRVPPPVWRTMIANANQHIDILEMSGSYLSHLLRLDHVLPQKLKEGVNIRVALGNPEGYACKQRSEEEKSAPDYIRSKILTMLQALTRDGTPLVPIRIHDRTLYSSLLRADDEMLVNVHLLGQAASYNPVLHVTNTGPLFKQLHRHFEALWESLSGDLGSPEVGDGKNALEGEITADHAPILARWGVI